MDIFLLIKSIFIGIIWGGSFLWIASVGVHMFPLPAMFDMRRTLLAFTLKKYKKSPALGERYWSLFLILFKICAIALWVAIMAAFVLGLMAWLNHYLPAEIQAVSDYWIYFSVAAVPCGLLMLWWGIRFFILGKTPPKELAVK